MQHPWGIYWDYCSRQNFIFSSSGRSPGRAIVLPPASAAGAALAFYVKVFYVIGKALSGKLSCPCDRTCSCQRFIEDENNRNTLG